MPEAFSRLKNVLDQNGLSTADLVRRILENGDRINPKSVYRLADPEEPLEKVDMRVVGAICHALGVGIGDLLTFEEPTGIEQFPTLKQTRMDNLLARDSSNQPLSAAELEELQALVEEAEAMARRNARRLANRRRRLLRHAGKRSAKPQPENDSDNT